jgi:hypothetical protein
MPLWDCSRSLVRVGALITAGINGGDNVEVCLARNDG